MKTTDIGFERFKEDFYADHDTMYIKSYRPREKPIKIEFNCHARGFYCPNCSTGVENKDQKCSFCGQELLDAYGFNNKQR